ncbi:MAG: methyltransferase domain-containing protein [Bacteroidetes Order II. Incertae sedis bacterium]|nr:methyltransferase domain-containing protein [Bacteroidetes Order II. bacterium]
MKKKIGFLTLIWVGFVSQSLIWAQEHGSHKPKDAPHTNSANEHMHHSSVQEWAQSFESPERDAYQQPEKVMRYLGNIRGKTIMDIGAGSGYFSVKLAAKGAKVIAAEVSEEFQSLLNTRIEKEKLKNIALRKIRFDDSGLRAQEADMVLIVNT